MASTVKGMTVAPEGNLDTHVEYTGCAGGMKRRLKPDQTRTGTRKSGQRGRPPSKLEGMVPSQRRPSERSHPGVIADESPLRMASFFLEYASPRRYDPERGFGRNDRKMRPIL